MISREHVVYSTSLFISFIGHLVDPGACVDVIIVGAGASGLSAGGWLASHGFKNLNLTILEAGDRIGGRVHSIDFGEGDWIELGAQYIHGQQGNIAYQMANNLSLVDDDDNYADERLDRFVFERGPLLPRRMSTRFWRLIKSFENEYTNYRHEHAEALKTYVDWFFENKVRRRNSTIISAVKDYLHRSIQIENAADSWSELSYHGNFIAYEYLPGHNEVIFKKGQSYLSLLKHIAKSIPKNSIRLNSKVTLIERGSHGCNVTLENGDTLEADFVIFTASLGVLNRSLDIFHPPLPRAKRNAVKKMGFGTVDKIFLKFPNRWWSENSSGFSFLFRNPSNYTESEDWTRSMLGGYTVKHVDNILVLWIAGAGARKMEKLSDSQVKSQAITFLRNFLSNTNLTVPEPIKFKVTRWYSNPLFRGSYSFHSVETAKQRITNEALAKPVGRLLFAGEATHAKYFSTVHGAIESGIREANRIIKKLEQVTHA